MKKQKLQIISLTAAAAIMLQTGVFAFGGTYPSHPDLPQFSQAGMQEPSKKESWQKSDADHLFTVGTKTFILLDTDEEGNYFVMANDAYGYHTMDTSYANNMKIESVAIEYPDGSAEQPVKDEEGNIIFSQQTDMSTVNDEEWKFNPEDSNNIAFWLNNNFWTNGNGGDYVLPDAIKNNVVEKEWEVEGFQARPNWTANNNYDSKYGVKRAADFAATRSFPKYTVKANLALMSLTEYKQYQDIIGFEKGEKGWNGFALRTPHALINTYEVQNSDKTKVIERGIRYTWGGIQVVNNGTEKEPKTGNMKICTIDAPATAESYVRPVMWLNKDFFKNVKCEPNTAGSLAKYEILKNSQEDLLKIYDPAELNVLMGSNPTWDWGHYPSHPGDVKKLTRTNVNTNGVLGASPAENLFTIGGRRFILLDRNMNGEYFVMADEEYGQRPFVPEDYINTLPTDKKEWMASDWEFNPAINNSIPFYLNSAEYGFISGNTDFAFSYSEYYTGNKDKKIIPTEMLDDLVEYDWEIEPFYPEFSWKTDGAENPAWNGDDTISEKATAEASAWLEKQLAVSEKKTVTAKLANLSYTEYQTYKNKIGLKDYVLNPYDYAGIYLRTNYAMVDGGNKGQDGSLTDSWSIVPGPMTVRVALDGDKNPSKVIFSYSNIGDDKYMVRPVMWLAKDFFKNNKIDVDTAGDTVFAEMRDLYTCEDLAGTYSLAEIDKMGIDVEKLTNVACDAEDLSTATAFTVSANAVNLGKNGTVIVAAYKDGKLAGVNFQKVDFTDVEENASVPVSVTVDKLNGADSVKVMLWSGLDGEKAMAPEYVTEL